MTQQSETYGESRTADLGGPVHYVDFGGPDGGSAVVLVHGLGGSHLNWDLFAPLLRPDARVLALDLPGFGRSEPGDRRTTVQDNVKVLDRFVREVAGSPAVLVGNSMGGPVCLEVAHSAPERVAGVVLASPAGGVHNQPLGRALVQLARDVGRENPRMVRVVLPDYLRFGPMNALQLFGELVRFPSLERVLRTPVPTLAVIGSRDPLMPPPWRVREVGRLAPPHLTIAVIEGAAHAMNFSHPGELAHVIGSWLDGREITDDPDQPGVARVVQLRRDDR